MGTWYLGSFVDGIKSLPAKKIDMSGSRLKSGASLKILKNLAENVKDLNLSNSKFSTNCMQYICSSITGGNFNIEKLTLENCGIDDTEVRLLT